MLKIQKGENETMNSPESILRKARETYGDKNQIIVSIEECNELSAILAKFARYHNSSKAVLELKSRVLDEVSDVLIVLEHVKAIFNITEEEIISRRNQKLERLERWLDTSTDMEQTTIDREIHDIGENK